MPNRIIREGILTSERVNQLKPHAELFYRRLMSVVDDFGRYTAHPSLIRAACYPLRIDDVREADITRWLAEVQSAGLIALYAVNGKQYVEMLDFRQQSRAKSSKFPERPQDGGGDVHAHHMRSTRCASALGDGDGDVCGDGGDLSPAEPGGERAFDRFWRAYPRRVGKRKARQAWNRLGLDSKADIVIRAVEAHKKSDQWKSEGGRFIPHPSTWLNRGGWEDEVEPALKLDPDNDPYAFRSLTDDELAKLSPPQPSDPGYAAYVEAREEYERAQREGGSAA